MTYPVTASNIPQSVPREKVLEFFSFCGKIESIQEEASEDSTRTYVIGFASHSAVSTALLLNSAELGGAPVLVTSDHTSPPSYADTREEGVSSEASNPELPLSETGDIDQELKPKSTIFAEYLSQGYVIGDNLIQQAVEYDKSHGYTEKFNIFLSDLDKKYNLQDKQKDLQNKQHEIDSKYQITSNLNRYFDKALQTGVGAKLHSFYTNVVNDTLQIHEEAKRLAEIKKKQRGSPLSSGTGVSHETST